MAGELDIALSATAVVETFLRETMRSLVASGALTREEVAKILLRTEVIAVGLDEGEAEGSEGAQPDLHGGYARILQSQVEDRLGLKPELFVLRRRRKEWLRLTRGDRFLRTIDPIETPLPPFPDDDE